MLTRSDLLNQLNQCIRAFNVSEEYTAAAIPEALDTLVSFFPNINNTDTLPTPDEASKVDLLRHRLRLLLDAENNYHELLKDKAFECLIILARGFPNNTSDPFTLQDFDNTSELIFLSSGYLIEKASAQEYFSHAASRQNGDYVHYNVKLSHRELISLRAQGIPVELTTRITMPFSQRVGRIIGGTVAALGTLFILMNPMLMPIYLLIPAVILGLVASYIPSRYDGDSPTTRLYTAVAGILMMGAVISLLCPPVLGFLVAQSAISATAAMMFSASWQMTMVSMVLPSLLLATAAARSYVAGISLSAALFSVTAAPVTLMTYVGGLIGKSIGSAIHLLKNLLNRDTTYRLEPAQLVRDTHVEVISTTATIQQNLGIDHNVVAEQNNAVRVTVVPASDLSNAAISASFDEMPAEENLAHSHRPAV